MMTDDCVDLIQELRGKNRLIQNLKADLARKEKDLADAIRRGRQWESMYLNLKLDVDQKVKARVGDMVELMRSQQPQMKKNKF